MKRCEKCLIPTTRPDTEFVAGVCSACIAYERRSAIDWEARRKELLELLERHGGRAIVASSGGKDSHAIVLALKSLGARVTAVTATTCMLTQIGRRNLENLACYADETVIYTPDMRQRARLNRLGLEMVGDISHPEHMAIFTVPFRAAVQLGIPLVFYGENPQDQYGGPLGAQQAREMTLRWRSEFGGFLGLRPSDLVAMAGDMSYYEAPSADALHRAAVEVHFLGQYLPWDSHGNALLARKAGMQQSLPCAANWWDHENLDNAQTGLHDYLMWRKYGYGRACAQLSVDIRAGLISREQAWEELQKREGRFPEVYSGVGASEMLERIGLSREKLEPIVARFTNWEIFESVADCRAPFAVLERR